MRTLFLLLGAALTTPLMLLNWLAGIVGGIWLIFRGDWSTLGIAFVILFGGLYVLPIVMTIGFSVGMIGVRLREKHRVLSYPFFAFLGLFNFAIMTAWCVLVFTYMLYRSQGSPWPYILVGYALATSGWSAMAQEEIKTDPHSTSLIWVSGAQFGSAAIIASIIVGNGFQTQFGMLVFFIPVALLGMALGYFMVSERRRSFV